MIQLLPCGLAALAGVCLCAGSNHLQTVGVGSQRLQHQLFAAMCFLFAAGAIACIFSTQSTQATDSVVHIRWIFTIVCLINLIFPWFVAAYTHARRTMFFSIAINAAFVALLVANWLRTYGLWFSAFPTLQPRTLPWGEQVTVHTSLSHNGWHTAFWTAMFVMFIYFLVLCVVQFRRGQGRRALILAGGIGVLLLACGNDYLSSIGFRTLPNAGLFAFLGLITIMNWDLRYQQRQASKQMHDLLNNVPAVIYVKDVAGRYLFINRHFEQLANLDNEQIRGKTDTELFAPAIAQLRASHEQQTLTAQQPQRFEELLEKDGVQRTYLSLKFPLCRGAIAGGAPYAVASVSTDITERMRTEQALRSSEAQTRLLLDSTEQGIMGIDSEGRCTFINSVGLSLLGYSDPQALHGTFVNTTIFGSAAHSQDAFEAVRLTLQTGKRNYATHALCRHRDGGVLAVEYWSHPIRSKNAVVGAVVSFADISERKRVDNAIRALAEAAASLDSDDFFPHCVRDLAEVYGAQYAIIGLIDHARHHIRTVAAYRHGEIVANFEYDMINTPCEKISIQSRWLIADNLTQLYPNEMFVAMGAQSYLGTPIVSPIGQTIGIVSVLGQQPLRIGSSSESLLDVFAHRISVELDRKLAFDHLNELKDSLERRVIERTRELSESNEELEAFSYSVSHDLRSPLTAIDGFSQLLLEQYRGSLDETGRRLINHIVGSTQRMNLLIDALLSLARISRQTLRLGTVDMTALAFEAIDKLKTMQPERQVALSIAPQLTAYADQGLLSVVLDNLLGNAWKYTGKTHEARIEFGVMQQDQQDVFFVRDNGAGFDPHYASRLFQPFKRLHHETDFPGTGIGLATVSRIVRHHGGRIWAEGAPNAGACFYFTLQQAKLPHVESMLSTSVPTVTAVETI